MAALARTARRRIPRADRSLGGSCVVGRRSPTGLALTREHDCVRLACAPPSPVARAPWLRSLPVPLSGSRRREEGQNPGAFNQIGTKPPSRWDNAGRSTTPAPQSKPVTPASRLMAQVAPSVASGLGLRILAAGPARHRLYSDCGRYVDQARKFPQAHSRGGYRPIGPQRLTRFGTSVLLATAACGVVGLVVGSTSLTRALVSDSANLILRKPLSRSPFVARALARSVVCVEGDDV